MRYQKMYRLILLFVAAQLLVAVMLDDPVSILHGLWKIITMQDILITDYVSIAGPGAALVNSALVTLSSLVILYLCKDPLNGFTIALIGLMSGFSMFGKNIANIWPIILGSWTYARMRGEPFVKYVNVGLMATALSPLVSYMALGSRNAHPLSGLLMGVIIGYVLPSLSAYTYKVQNGMNLYNMGFACGMLAMIIVPILSAMGDAPQKVMYWAEGYNTTFAVILTILCTIFIFSGLFLCERPAWAAWAGYRRLLQTTGRASSDYLRMFGAAPVLINMGVNGLVATGYILLTQGDLNGATLGGIFTIIGFSAFGKHVLNIVPIMVGVSLGGTFLHYDINAPALQLAGLFGTTLAPVAGVFGWPYGVLAGFLHSAVVLQAGAVHMGVNLYNNGFSGGLVAIVLYPTITAIARQRNPELQKRDLFRIFANDAPQKTELDHPDLPNKEPGPPKEFI